MEEIWKDIPNYEGLYQASTLGQIRTCEGKTTSNQRYSQRRWKQRVLKQKLVGKSGYMVCLWKDGSPKYQLVHRLIATTFLENLVDTKMTVNHKNGNRLDNRLENLEWMTLADNIRHGFDNGFYSTKKKCTLISGNETINFDSVSSACRFLKRRVAYIRGCLDAGCRITSADGKEYKISFSDNQ